MINPHQVYPTTPQKELLPWWQGWLGLVIGSFGLAGGVADMLWVLDGRAGMYNRAEPLSRGWGH